MATPRNELGVFRIIDTTTAPTRPGRRKPQEVSAPFIPKKPRTITIPKPIFPEEPEKQKKGIGKKIKAGLVVLAGLAVLEGAGAVATQLINNQPMSVETIKTDLAWPWNLGKSAIADISDLFRKKEAVVVVSPTPDNKTARQTVQAGVNLNPTSIKEAPSLIEIKPVEKGKFPDVTILLPLKLKAGEKVGIRTNWIRNAFNPVNPESKEDVAYGKIITIAQKGTEIIVPVANAEVGIGTKTVGTETNMSSLSVIFYGPDGTKYSLAIMLNGQDIRRLQPTDLIKKTLSEGKNRLPLPLGTSIATTAVDNLEVEFSLFTYPVGYSESVPCDFSLAEKEENGKRFIAFIPQKSS